jgi:hemolysin III
MRRLHHPTIFILIAGTYTSMGLMVLPRPLGNVLLTTVSVSSLAGINLAWVTAPRWLAAVLHLRAGWIAVAALLELVDRMSGPTLLLLALGRSVYSAGALVYASERPNPAPAVFGYHEVFHALAIVAAGMHFAAVASVVLPTL